MFSQKKWVVEEVSDFFVEAEAIHKKKLEGRRIDCHTIIVANIFSDEDFESDFESSWSNDQDSNKFDIESLQEQHWYHLDHDGSQLKCQLLCVSELIKQLLLLIYLGS